MELTNNRDESLRATELGHDLPQPHPADSVEGLGQVHEGGVEVLMMVRTLVLQLAGCENHIHCPPAYSKATLAFGKVTLLHVVSKLVKQNAGKNFSRDQQG